jgi:sugar lactone lactonase YvrE
VTAAFEPLPLPASLLGESPLWHPVEQQLYWCDIPGRRLHRFDPQRGLHAHWDFDVEPASIAPLLGGGLLLAMRDGLWRFDTERGRRERLAAAPYDPKAQRFNDGKADALGRFWVGTLDEARQPRAALYCLAAGRLERRAEGITVSNGLAFSPDGATMYWADTTAHEVHAFDLDRSDGSLSRRRVLARFAPRAPGQPLADYGGRPDGAAVDVEGAYWVAMYEGQRLLRLSHDGALLAEMPLPVRCPTMPCFGGVDLKTLYLTTARHHRPEAELALQPWAGRVLSVCVDVPGLPANFAQA